MSLARAAVAFVFAALVALCLAVPARRAGRLANAAVWGLWEPGLVVVFLAVGRVWCGVCPIASAGALAARVKTFARAPAAWMKKGRVVLAVAALAFIFWVERVFHMLERPRATGVLLAALAVLAVGFSVVWARATWCRYVCPLGALGSAFAVAAPLEVRAAQGICTTQCTTHDCYKACPVFHHPMYTNESHVCTLCLRCVRVCPNGSAGLFARAPFQSLWRLPSLDPTLSALALALALVALVVLASLDPFWARHPTAFTAAIAVAAAAGVLLGGRLGALAGGDEPSAAPGPRAIAGIAILAWGPLMAYQLANVRFLGDVGLTVGEGRISARAVLQSLATVAAADASALLLWRTRRYFEKKGSAPDGAGWGLLHAVWSVYVAAACVLTGAAASLP
jgi:ferredoxin